MKEEYLRCGLSVVLIVCLFACPVSCGSPGGSGNIDDPYGEETEEPVASITDHFDSLAVRPTTTIRVGGTATVSVDARDAGNAPVPNGTTIAFAVENSAFGSITESSTTTDGIATATFTAVNQPGTARITASSGLATGSVDIEIEQAPAAAIEFVNAVPNLIALAGIGGQEISTVTFLVVDSNHTPLEGVNVTFGMDGPGGGAYMGPATSSTNASGIATVRLYSGVVAGPVTVSATTGIGDPPIPTTVESTTISIGGGVPSDWFFSIAASTQNLPGLACANEQGTITAYLADRFGNYNVLQGTSVSFASERGLHVDTAQATLQDDGTASVAFRTQGGAPENVGQPGGDWEDLLHADILNDYGFNAPGYPRDGLCSILVYARGEEHFNDLNANGFFDPGEFKPAYDTIEDPFIDYNSNGTHDDGLGTDPFELYIDDNDNGSPDVEDGAWNDNKYIFRNYQFLITGQPYISFYTPSGTAVPDDGTREVYVLVCDRNLNQLMPGTTVNMTQSVGGIRGETSRIWPDSNAVGPDEVTHRSLIEFSVELYDDNPGDPGSPTDGELEVEVVWPECTDTGELTLTVILYYTVD